MSERHIRKLDAKLATVGIDVPARIELFGDTIELEQRLFGSLRLDEGDPDRVAFRSEVSDHLRELRRALSSEANDVAAEDLLRSGRILKKVLFILDSVDDPGPHRDAADVKRWLDFVEKIRHD